MQTQAYCFSCWLFEMLSLGEGLPAKTLPLNLAKLPGAGMVSWMIPPESTTEKWSLPDTGGCVLSFTWGTSKDSHSEIQFQRLADIAIIIFKKLFLTFTWLDGWNSTTSKAPAQGPSVISEPEARPKYSFVLVCLCLERVWILALSPSFPWRGKCSAPVLPFSLG